MYQIGEKQMQGNQLSSAGGASAPYVREIAEILIDMTSGYMVRSDNGQIILSQPDEELLNICAVCLNGQRAFVQFKRKLV